MSAVKIYTDGSNIIPRGPGCFAVVIAPVEDVSISDKTVFFSGGSLNTSGHEMELTAVLEALTWIEKNELTEVEIYSDSEYTVNGCNILMHRWKKNGYMKSNKGREIRHTNLWNRIYDKYCKTKTKLIWIKGHNGNPFNNFADSLAGKAANNFKEQATAYYNRLNLGDIVVTWRTAPKGNVLFDRYTVLQLFLTNATVVLKPVNGGKPVIMSQKEFDSRKFIGNYILIQPKNDINNRK